MEKTQDELVEAVTHCNEKIVEFVRAFNKDEKYKVFCTAQIPLDSCLDFMESEEINKSNNSNLAMAKFYYNARSTYMNRLVQIADSEVA